MRNFGARGIYTERGGRENREARIRCACNSALRRVQLLLVWLFGFQSGRIRMSPVCKSAVDTVENGPRAPMSSARLTRLLAGAHKPLGA